MKFETEIWDIRKLIDVYESGNLNLNPPYQRNEIWSSKSKKLLIDSIKQNFPLPNFFIYKKNNNEIDMVDGQQRTRTILGFYAQRFPDLDKNYYNQDTYNNFLDYEITIISITELDEGEDIEEFYARVNSTGLKLNRPELKKAEYYNTRFLELLQELASDSKFENLDLFTESSLNRMNDIDFISELVTQLKEGNTEKKIIVDRIFENDITLDEAKDLKEKFNRVLDILVKLNSYYPLKKTRYKQRNDFYTLFGFIRENSGQDYEIFEYFYKILVLIGEDITPSNEKCEPFKEYARNCVTQSNSKKARDARLSFFNELFLNEEMQPNSVQEQVMEFYEFEDYSLFQINNFYTLNAKQLQKIVQEPVLSF